MIVVTYLLRQSITLYKNLVGGGLEQNLGGGGLEPLSPIARTATACDRQSDGRTDGDLATGYSTYYG